MIEQKHAREWLKQFLIQPTNEMFKATQQLYAKYLKETHLLFTNAHTQKDPQKVWVWIRLRDTEWTKRETLTAHVDTVSDYDVAPKMEDIVETNGVLTLDPTADPKVKCLGGDDRAGIAMIWKVVEKLTKDQMKVNFNLFFPFGEERGTQGTREFMKTWKGAFKTPYMLGFDRRGNDVVSYDFAGEEFISEVERVFSKKRGYGSCSDISVFQAELQIPSVNVSVGFKNEHSRTESLDLAIWAKTTWDLLALMKDPYSREYLADQKWEQKTYGRGWSQDDWDLNIDGYQYPKTTKVVKKTHEEELADEYELGYKDGWDEAMKEVGKFPGDYLKDSSVLAAVAKLVAGYVEDQLTKEKSDDTKTTRTKRSWFTFKRKGN